MKLCPYCQKNNLEGVLYCEECGTPLIGDDIVPVAPSATNILSGTLQSPENKPLWGKESFTEKTTINIRIKETGEKLPLPRQEEVVLGRGDKNSNIYPDIDLTHYGGVEKGVSRIHATIRRTADAAVLIDLDSANGTYINGVQLAPNNAHILRDGDEVRLGKLVAFVSFA